MMNLGVMHNENYVFSAQNTGSDGVLLKINAENGDLSKSWKFTGVRLGQNDVFNRLVTAKLTFLKIKIKIIKILI